MTESMRNSLHSSVVKKALRRFAERLKSEGSILDYDFRSFKFPLEDLRPFVIKPDLAITLRNRKKVVVEVVNPRDPKRFLGELTYISLLYYYKKIIASLVFVLPCKGEYYKRLEQRVVFGGMFRTFVFAPLAKPENLSMMTSWSKDEEASYGHLKAFVQDAERFV